MARHLTRTLLLLAGLLPACSENFGPAPPDGGQVVRVSSESFTGPRTDRIATGAALSGNTVMIGTDSGLFRFDTTNPRRWLPLHGGYLTPDGIERPGQVRELVLDAAGRLVFFRGIVATFDALVCSPDGGRSFERLDRPDALLTAVDAIGVAPPGALGVNGAWLAAQGGQVFERAVGEESWLARLLPRAPQSAGPLCADAAGQIAFAVASPTAADFTVWTSAEAGTDFAETGLVLSGPALALAWSEGELCVATGSGIQRGADDFVSWAGASVLDAALEQTTAGLGWALVARRADGEIALAQGTGAGVVLQSVPLPREDVADIALAAQSVRVLFADGSSWDARSSVDPYAGVEIDFYSLASRPDLSALALGHFRTGEIYQGPVDDPGAYATRGTPLQSSAPRSVRFDPVVDDALFVASFGVYRSAPSSAAWEERNQGFSSYDPFFFAGPFPVSAFVILDEQEFWVGGINGDGPYRSTDAGLNWVRVHDGLGPPGGYLNEAGLPLVSQVQGFARAKDQGVWMAAFRGGALRLAEQSGVWEQRSSGLPGVDGLAIPGCCPVPGESEVDLRDIVAVEDGALLAATGWGIYRLGAGQTQWEPRSTGLFNLDVRQLLRHPDDSATVVATARGRADAPDWLFFTEDAGRTWFPVRGELAGRNPIDLTWTDPARLELVVLLEAQGAWRMVLKP